MTKFKIGDLVTLSDDVKNRNRDINLEPYEVMIITEINIQSHGNSYYNVYSIIEQRLLPSTWFDKHLKIYEEDET